MFEFWAVFGRACMDGRFRQTFKRVTHDGSHKDIQRFLARGPFNLRMSREESKGLKHFFTEGIYSQLQIIDEHCNSSSFDFPEDLEYCAVVGLALMDGKFRTKLYDYSSADELYQLAEYLAGDSQYNYVKFDVPEDRLEELAYLMKHEDTVRAMDEAAQNAWRPPTKSKGKANTLLGHGLLTSESICPEGIIFDEVDNIVALHPGVFRELVLKIVAISELIEKDEIEIVEMLLAKLPLLDELLKDLSKKKTWKKRKPVPKLNGPERSASSSQA